MPTLAPTDLVRLGKLIELELQQMGSFVELLEREEELLIANEVDALLALSEEKTQRYRNLQRIHDQRALLVGTAGFPNHADSIREALTPNPAMQRRWDEVLELARTAQLRNVQNGQMINERLAHNQAAMSILFAATERPQFYGPDGQTRASGSGRILGSA